MNKDDKKGSSCGRISVVTVARNVASLLRLTIESVAGQDYPEIEYIVVDGASSDGSAEMAAASARVDKWVSESDKGIYDAMNKGCRMASGEWILFMNAGDTFASPDAVSRLMEAAAGRSDADVVYGDVIRSGGEGMPDTVKAASDTCKPHRLAFCHQSVMCRRRLLLEHPFDITHRYSADFKFFKTLEKLGCKFLHAHFPVARFDISGISSRHRSAGIADNMRVICEVDGFRKGLPALLHLLPTYLISRLRGK